MVTIMSWFTEWWQEIGLIGQIMACAAIPMTVVLLLQAVLMLIGLGLGHDPDGGVDSDDAGFDADSDADFDTDFDADFDADFTADLDSGFDADFSAGLDMDASVDVEIDYDLSADMDVDAGVGFDSESDFDAGFDSGGAGFNSSAGLHSGTGFHSDGAGAHTGASHAASHTGGLKLFTVRGIVAFFAIGGWAGLAALTAGVKPLWAVQIALVAGVAAMLLASVVIKFALRMQSSGNIDLRNAIAQTAEVYITIPPLRSKTGRVTMVLQERFIEIEAVTDSETPLKTNTMVEIVGLAGSDCLVVRQKREDKH